MSESTYQIISQASARDQGLNFYFTGKPCKRGHIDRRRVANRVCQSCEVRFAQLETTKEKVREYYAAHKEEASLTNKLYIEKNKNRLKKLYKQYREENKEKIKEHNRQYREENKEYFREYNKQYQKEYGLKYREENKEYISHQLKEYRHKNKEKIARYNKEYIKRNPAKSRYWVCKRQATKLLATPNWLTLEHDRQMIDIYDDAVKKSISTGIKHHVDHIIPLQGETVCGLHVPWNLQVITAKENLSKGNKLLET